jgi:hypothetical protein
MTVTGYLRLAHKPVNNMVTGIDNDENIVYKGRCKPVNNLVTTL